MSLCRFLRNCFGEFPVCGLRKWSYIGAFLYWGGYN